MSAATEIEEQAARWVTRRGGSDWSAADQQDLDLWLNSATAHRVAYLRLAAVWQRADRLQALQPGSLRPEATPAPPAWWRRPAPALAASLCAALVLVGAVVGVHEYRAEPAYVTEVGGSRTLSLADGTRVELNTDTQLRTEVNAKTRTTWLDRGEAYFEVAHDASRPFVVIAGDRRVTVLGTRFSVRRDGNKVSVLVTEGRVRVDGPTLGQGAGTAAPVELQRGDVALAQDGALLVKSKPLDKLANELGWRRKVLVFDETNLGEAAEEFNRYNQKKLVISDPSIARIRIGGSFDPSNVDAFARLLAQGFHLQITAREEEILLSR